MPLYPIYQPHFSNDEVQKAQQAIRRHTTGQTEAKRASLLLLLAEDSKRTSPDCARELGCHEQTVRKWRKRWSLEEVSLKDKTRGGRKSTFSPLQEAAVKAIACELPATRQLPFSRFSTVDIANVAISEGIVLSISPTTVWRWLDKDAIRPWYHQSWVFPRDKQFLTKAQPVLELYQGFWVETPLGDDDFVRRRDEKPIQVLERCHRQAAREGQIGRYDYQYERHGSITYLAALDVFCGKVFGHTSESNGIIPFSKLVDDVMEREPYKNANRVFWIVDNGCAHHPNTFGARLGEHYPNAIAVHLPTHASWLNQIEIYFSIVTRKLLKPSDFSSVEELLWKLSSFEEIYNETAQPFNWKFTKEDLEERFKHLDKTLYGIVK